MQDVSFLHQGALSFVRFTGQQRPLRFAMPRPSIANAHVVIRLLAIVRKPFAFCQLQICESRFEGSVLRAARVDAERDRSSRLEHVADPHLLERDAVKRVFDAKIILPAAETKPYGMRAFHFVLSFVSAPSS